MADRFLVPTLLLVAILAIGVLAVLPSTSISIDRRLHHVNNVPQIESTSERAQSLSIHLSNSAMTLATHTVLSLVELYKSCHGDQWLHNTGWLQGGSVCGWFGVQCNSGNTSVTALMLNNNGLSGTITPSLAALTNLAILDLSVNAITGSIPASFSMLYNITSLYVRSPCPRRFRSSSAWPTLVRSPGQQARVQQVARLNTRCEQAHQAVVLGMMRESRGK